jgi:SAM-dependent methyltransferase
MNFRNTIKKNTPEYIWNFLRTLKFNYLRILYRTFGRKYHPGETSKAKNRRLEEGFFDKFCKGNGLDIGFGGDPVVEGVQGYDFEHGDAQYLNGIRNNFYDFVYSSHTIEHLDDPYLAVKNWFDKVKPGGYLIIYLPHRDFYEKKKELPSRFNPNHKNFFLIDRDEKPDTIGIVPLVEKVLNNYKIIYVRECNTGWTIKDPEIHSNGEYSIEIVIQKNTN